MHFLWNLIFYKPLYNGLVFLVSVVPGGDIGVALILLTILVKIILFPVSRRSIHSQEKLRALEPEIAAIKKNFPTKEEQAAKTMELYKANKVNPFSGCLLLLIQLPIIFALYYVFYRGLPFASADIYSFLHVPTNFTTNFLGIVDIQHKSIVLAILAGISQFFQIRIAGPKTMPGTQKSGEKKSFMEDLTKSMNTQMRYVLPVFIVFVAYKVSAAIALYWVTSNIVAIIQELMVRRKMVKKHELPATIEEVKKP